MVEQGQEGWGKANITRVSTMVSALNSLQELSEIGGGICISTCRKGKKYEVKRGDMISEVLWLLSRSTYTELPLCLAQDWELGLGTSKCMSVGN